MVPLASTPMGENALSVMKRHAGVVVNGYVKQITSKKGLKRSMNDGRKHPKLERDASAFADG